MQELYYNLIILASSPGSHITEESERRDSEICGGRQKAGAGKRAWYTLIRAWADFPGIPRNCYTLASVHVSFTALHASARRSSADG